MCHANIIMNLPSCNQGILGRGNQLRQQRSKAIRHDLRQYFVRIVTKANKSELKNRLQIWDFRDEDNMCEVNLFGIVVAHHKIINQAIDLLRNISLK